MAYPVQLEGLEGQNIEVKTGFFSGAKLLINGQPAPKGTKRGQMLLHRNDGTDVVAAWKSQLLGFDVPLLEVDGKVINVVRPLKWYVWVWSGLPILLVFAGGALGGVIGIISFGINTQIFRGSTSTALKFVLSGAVSLVALVAYALVAGILLSLLFRL